MAHRKVFLSKLIYQTYNGYVMNQFKSWSRTLGIANCELRIANCECRMNN